MADFTFNVSLGRGHEFVSRIRANDPANSALKIVALAYTGLESDGVLKDFDTLAAVLAGTTNEVTNGSYARKTLTDADLSAPTIDDTNDVVTLDSFADQVFATIASGDSWAKMLVCMDFDTTSGGDSDIIPITAHDLLIDGGPVIPNGQNITWSLPTGFLVCS